MSIDAVIGDRTGSDDSTAVRLDIHLTERTGRVHGGASGMLYGLSDAGVPADALIAGARPRTIAQKAPGGRQHPTGDAIEVADAFFAGGGEEILVYMQDIYEQWPYEQLGMDDYLAKVRIMVAQIAARDDADRFSWVPFNEPDWIWYGDWANDRERFFADWEAVYREIRQILPTARIVGMNDMEWSRERMSDFLPWAAENDLLPDTIAWHELRPESLATYRQHYRDYRALEAELEIPPIPININEYGNRRDFSNPAQVLQWLAMFEETKVDADMAFWTFAGNLSDHAVQSAQANGGWWLLAWYAGLTGDTVRTSPLDGVGVIAAVDDDRRQVTILLGGTDSAVEVVVGGLGADFAGSEAGPRKSQTEAQVTLTRTSWTGYEGDATVPLPTSRVTTPVSDDGSIVVAIPAGDPMAAWRIDITPIELDVTTLREPWRATWEAEDAQIVAGEVTIRDDDPQKSATSGGRDVTGLVHPTSAVTFTVEVPHTDLYRLGVFYGTDSRTDRHSLFVDGRFERILHYPATLNQAFRGRLDVPIELTAGAHDLALRTSGPDGANSPEAANYPEAILASDVALDRIDVTLDRRPGAVELDARSARLTGSAILVPGSSTAPASARVSESGSASFFVSASGDGYHDVSVDLGSAGGSVEMRIAGRPVIPAREVTIGRHRIIVRVHLARGISELAIAAPAGSVEVILVAVQSVPESELGADTVAYRFDAEQFTLTDGARLVRPRLADASFPFDAAYVDGLAEGRIEIRSDREWQPGAYNLAVEYGNAAKNQAHEYNTDVISAAAVIEVEGAGRMTPILRHSYAWDNFWSSVVPVDMIEPGRTISLRAPDAAPTIRRLILSPLVLSLVVDP